MPKNLHSTRSEDLERMKQEAREMPGIAELAEVYSGFQDVVSVAAAYLAQAYAPTFIAVADTAGNSLELTDG